MWTGCGISPTRELEGFPYIEPGSFEYEKYVKVAIISPIGYSTNYIKEVRVLPEDIIETLNMENDKNE